MIYFNEKKEVFENSLEVIFNSQTTHLKEAMAYSLKSGGKRLRPTLFLSVVSLYREDWQNLLPFAMGLEMIHTYSLIHDDLPAMDNDDFRRGKPTNHKVYGEAMAILAGDGLLTEAFTQMASLKNENPANLLKAVVRASNFAGADGMIYGQSLDILGEGKSLNLQELKEIHYHKTGALICSALVCGAILGGASEEDIDKWEHYGENLGLAFQIVDDILDSEGTFEELGKPIGSDEESCKSTYMTILGIEGARKEATRLITEGNNSLSGISENVDVFREYATELLTRKA